MHHSLYIGTNYGKVFRVTKNGTKWITKPIHNPPLPSLFIWDIAPRPDNINSVIVVMAGVCSIDKPLTHVWRGEVQDEGIVNWSDISGKVNNRLPDTPVNCVVIEPNSRDTMYIGTDVSVFKTTNGGDTWARFSQGLPNCAAFDMCLHNPDSFVFAIW